jgi:uncharacterized membrane protein
MTGWLIDLHTLAIIAGMAAVTAATRFAGYAILGRRTLSARLRASLDAVPPAILAAIVAPVALSGGLAEALAALATLVVAWRAPVVVAIVAGVATVAGVRLAIG